jgi:hypothetical protein
MGKFSYKDDPLTFIEFSDFVEDDLHMLLRISDHLMDHLLVDVMEKGETL